MIVTLQYTVQNVFVNILNTGQVGPGAEYLSEYNQGG